MSTVQPLQVAAWPGQITSNTPHSLHLICLTLVSAYLVARMGLEAPTTGDAQNSHLPVVGG